MPVTFRGHHIWCNGDSRVDPNDCKWCGGPKGLLAKYPDDCSPNELVHKYFPNVIPRPGTGGTKMHEHLVKRVIYVSECPKCGDRFEKVDNPPRERLCLNCRVWVPYIAEEYIGKDKFDERR